MNIRAFINGQEGGTIQAPANSPFAFNGKLLNLDGSLFALGAGTITLNIYDRQDRSDTLALGAACTITTAADGSFTGGASAAQFTLKPGQYYGFVAHVLSGVASWGLKPVTIIVF